MWWRQALQVEEVLLRAGYLFGLSLDYSKCFDQVPVHVLLQLAVEQGLSPPLSETNVCASLRQRFRVGVGTGVPFKSTNGIIQGFLLSVVLLNLLVNVWSRAVRVEAPAPVCLVVTLMIREPHPRRHPRYNKC